ncbi:heme ABC transporter ATP-binding protein [Algihabitans albus]|uniref:heme ABC transporter ATP-binding protein n=1 Tax=Algihabitans albus TaxID=2164067 RepID=UPI000E5C7D2D|nr:heme ABC transporter ATP-binding protein [Algihabitans albus]
MLHATGLHFARQGNPILRGVDLALEPARVTALIGPNGAGKSTLLHLLSGALAPDGGTVTLDGRPLADWSRAGLARRRAVLPQSSELTFPFRVLEVVMMGRSAHNGRSSLTRDLDVAAATLDEVDAAHLAQRIYPTLSGGERQRVQLARVMAQIWPDTDNDRPRFLLLDEPTNNLDLTHQHRLLAFARRLAERGLGVFAVLHDPNLAALYADRLVLLSEGRVQSAGTVDSVLTEPQIERAFKLKVAIQRHPTRGCPQLIPL